MNDLNHQFPTRLAMGCARRLTVLAVCWTFALPLHVAYTQEPAPDRVDKEEPKRKSKVGKRLIREVTEGAEADIMDEIMRMMSDVGRRLDIEFDSGEETRAVQRDIVERLNNAILLAAKQRRRSRQSASSSRDRRRRPDQARPREKDVGQQQPDTGASSRSDSASTSQNAGSAGPKTGNLSETRRTWGNLPQRERDEVIQGSEEAHLERFREWIERYYRALQETEE